MGEAPRRQLCSPGIGPFVTSIRCSCVRKWAISYAHWGMFSLDSVVAVSPSIQLYTDQCHGNMMLGFPSATGLGMGIDSCGASLGSQVCSLRTCSA